MENQQFPPPSPAQHRFDHPAELEVQRAQFAMQQMAAMHERRGPQEREYSPEQRLTPQADLTLHCNIGTEEEPNYIELPMYVAHPVGHRDKNPTSFVLRPKVFEERSDGTRKSTNENIDLVLPVRFFWNEDDENGDPIEHPMVYPRDVVDEQGRKRVVRDTVFNAREALESGQLDVATASKLRALLLRTQYRAALEAHLSRGGTVDSFDGSVFEQAQAALLHDAESAGMRDTKMISPNAKSLGVIANRLERGSREVRTGNQVVAEVDYIFCINQIQVPFRQEELRRHEQEQRAAGQA